MMSSKKSTPRSGAKSEPSPQEINMLVALFKQGRYAEIETLARAMTESFPLHGFGWKAMGASLMQRGCAAEALIPLQKAAELSQGDAQLYNNLGNALANLDRLSEAEASYRQALKVNPSFVEAHYNLGSMLLKLGRLPEAEACYRQALKFNPDFVGAHYSLGNTLEKLGRPVEAEASYRRALKLKPDFVDAYNDLGHTLYLQYRLPEAEACYQRVLELKPDFAGVHYGLGNTFLAQGRLPEAEASYRRALQIKPDSASAHYSLGNALKRQGKLEAAAACFRSCLEIDPEDRIGARLLLAALGFEPVPLRASGAHLEAFYGKKAWIWDKEQTYFGAELVAQALKSQSNKSGKLDILDAGCGTGHVGLLIRDFANKLDGVDLSPGMLEKAREKKIYDNTYQSDLESFMQGNPNKYDAITCAATLIHFGDLSPVFGAAAACLRDDGLFVFTVFQNDSEQDGKEVVVAHLDGLAKNGCYVHGRGYITRLAEAAGFVVEMLDTEIHEYCTDIPMGIENMPIMCLVAALRRRPRLAGV